MNEVEVKSTLGECVPIMAKEQYVSTSIRVPEDKYKLLEEIKKDDGTPINALVLEGIDMLLSNRKEQLKVAIKERSSTLLDALNNLE